MGLLFAGIGLRFGISWTGAAEAVLAAGLVVLAFIDLDHMLLPKKIVYATLTIVGALLVAGAAAGSEWHRLLVAVIAAVVAWAVFFAINFIAPQALGFGDVRTRSAHRFRAWLARRGLRLLGLRFGQRAGFGRRRGFDRHGKGWPAHSDTLRDIPGRRCPAGGPCRRPGGQLVPRPGPLTSTSLPMRLEMGPPVS